MNNNRQGDAGTSELNHSLIIYEAISRLIEHKMNNVIQPMLGFTSILDSKLKDNADLYKYVKPLVKSANDAKSFTGNLMTAFVEREPEENSVNLGECTGATINKYFSSQLPVSIEIAIDQSHEVEVDLEMLKVCLREILAFLERENEAGKTIKVSSEVLEGLDKLPYDKVLALVFTYSAKVEEGNEIQFESIDTIASLQFHVIKYLSEMMGSHIVLKNNDDDGECSLTVYFNLDDTT